MLAALPFGATCLAACGVNLSTSNSPISSEAGQPQDNQVTKSSKNEAGAGPPPPASNLPRRGLAPAWNNSVWINSEPLTLSQLQGKVVLVEFWTFDCYNCQNVMPSLKSWYDDYSGRG